jgi:hypothetical protein
MADAHIGPLSCFGVHCGAIRSIILRGVDLSFFLVFGSEQMFKIAKTWEYEYFLKFSDNSY